MRLCRLVALAHLALALTACGGDAGASVSSADKAGCDAAYTYGGPASVGDESAARKLGQELDGAGPDDDYSQDISPYLQMLSADALLLTTGGSAPAMADHVDDAFEACKEIGWEAPE